MVLCRSSSSSARGSSLAKTAVEPTMSVNKTAHGCAGFSERNGMREPNRLKRDRFTGFASPIGPRDSGPPLPCGEKDHKLRSNVLLSGETQLDVRSPPA